MDAEPQINLDLVARYLVAGERVVIAVRYHWVTILEPIATAVLSLIFVIWVGATIPADFVAVADVLWWLWFAVLVRTLFLLWEWRRTWFVGTDRRLLLTYGVVVRRVAMMPLSKVTDMNYGRSLLGRLLGYGTFTMESAGQTQALSRIDHVPNPDVHYRAMVAEIFRGPTSTPAPDPDPDLEETDHPAELFDDDGVFLPDAASDPRRTPDPAFRDERDRPADDYDLYDEDEDFDHEENPRIALKRRRAAQRRREREERRGR